MSDRIFDPDREVWIERRPGEDDATALHRARYGRPPREAAAQPRPTNPVLVTFWVLAVVLAALALWIGLAAGGAQNASIHDGNGDLEIDFTGPIATIVLWGAAAVSAAGALVLHGVAWMRRHQA